MKWTDERSSSFVSDNHGRDHEQTAELALDAEGRFLAVRLNGYGNLGGFQGAMSPQPPTLNTVRNVISLYRTPLLEVNTKCVFTNTTFVSPYRGAGRPEGNYYMERLIDYAAAETGFDRIELRRKNQIRKSEIPFKSAAGTTYDSGDFPAILKQALDASDWKGFNKRKRESKKRKRLRGIGVGCYLEVTAPANKEMGGIAFDADGGVTIRTGTLDYGQGHASPFAQVLSEKLGVPFEKVRLLQGDSDELLAGGGTGGSRSMMNSGQAIVEAAAKVVEQGKQIASHALEASAGDIEFKDGKFVVAGTDRAIDIMELAQKVRAGMKPAAGRAAVARRQARQRGRAVGLSQRLPRLRGRDRSGHRQHRGGEIHRGERLRHHHQSDAGRRPDPRRRGAGHRPDPARARRLRRAGPAPVRLVHGLRHAARAPHAELRGAQPSGAGHDQSARRQGLRRGRLRRLAHLDHERGGRRAVGIRHQAHRHAGEPVAGLAGDPGRQSAAACNEGAMTAFRPSLVVRRRGGRDDVRLVAGVSAAHFVSHFYMLVLPPLFAFVRADYAVSYTEIGLALTMFNAVSAVAQTPAGFLIDRINARLALIAGLLLGAVGFAVAAVVDSYWVLIAAFGLVGLGNTVYHPADYALLSRHVAPERMSQAYSVHTFAGMLGSAAAPAAVLLMHGLYGWRGAFLGAAALGVAGGAWCCCSRPAAKPIRRPASPARRTSGPTNWRLLLTAPILVNFVFFTDLRVRQLRPAELFGGRARPALRHEPGDRQHRAVRLSAVERARRADRRLDRRAHDPPPHHRRARTVAPPSSPRC